jgi:protein LTV1
VLYGIYYDDKEYDYTQHLRSVGVQEKGVDSILIEVPSSSSRTKQKPKGKDFDIIPKEVLPSTVEVPHQRMLEAQEAIPGELQGFQPKMDPHLRQTLEALDNDTFIQVDADDGFFAEVMEGGERDDDEQCEFNFEEDGADADTSLLPKDSEVASDEENDQDWHVRFAKFKREQRSRITDGSVLDRTSEGGDTLGRLPSLSVLGAKKRKRKGTSEGSCYSMSSSSMFRNEGLTRLDEQFERVRPLLRSYYGFHSPFFCSLRRSTRRTDRLTTMN